MVDDKKGMDDDFNRPLPGYTEIATDDGGKIELLKAGDLFDGVFIERVEIENPNNGDTMRRLIFTNGNGERCWVWSTMQLSTAFRSIKPQTNVRIVFTGVKELDGGNSEKLFKVYAKS